MSTINTIEPEIIDFSKKRKTKSYYLYNKYYKKMIKYFIKIINKQHLNTINCTIKFLKKNLLLLNYIH